MGDDPKYRARNYNMYARNRLTNNPDGRKLHLSGQGGVVLQESSESEEEPLPPPPPAPRRAFASILEEAKTGKKKSDSKPSTSHQLNAANSNRSRREPAAKSISHDWPIPESHPNETKAEKIREADKSIKKVREGYLRTTAPICEKQHKVLVCQWSFSDPVNRKGTWSLEVVDFRRTLWVNEIGIEEHQQCSIGSMPGLLTKLAKTMIDHRKKATPNHIAHEPDRHSRQLLQEQLDSELLSSVTKIERELGTLAVYVMGSITYGSGGGDMGDKYAKGEENGKGKGNQKIQTLAEKAFSTRTEAERKNAEIAHTKTTMKEQRKPRTRSGVKVEKTSVLNAEAQRGHHRAQASVVKAQQATSRKTAELEMTEEDERLSKSIRAAARRDHNQQEQAEREEEERQKELFAQQDETGGAATREESPDDELSAAMLEFLGDAAPEPEAPKKKPVKKLQKTAEGLDSPVETAVNRSESEKRKRKAKSPAHVRLVHQDSSDSDSVKPPQPSKSAKPAERKPKAKPTIQRPTVSFAEHIAAKKAAQGRDYGAKKSNETREPSGRSKAPEKPKKKETKTAKIQTDKVRRSEELVADSNLDDDTTENVKLPSDKLQNRNMSVETTKSTSVTASIEQNGDVVEKAVDTTTVEVETQHEDGSVERTEVTEIIAVSSNSAQQGETTIEHSIYTQLIPTINVPAQDLLHNSPPSSADHELHDDSNTLGIDVTISPPSTPPNLAGSHRKRKRSTIPQETQPEQDPETKQQHNVPSSPKKRKTTLPRSSLSSDKTSSPETAPSSPQSTLTSPLTSPATVSTSPVSSSSRKRKAPELASSPCGLKRARCGQSNVVVEGTKEDSETGEDGKKSQTVGECESDSVVPTDYEEVERDDVLDVEVESDAESYDSLFDEDNYDSLFDERLLTSDAGHM